ncbi:MAG TPA: hypothetical protein VGP76_18615 [Planctomycetaceae bacterium]|jgi:hypothetical protein|nr:hypothetical protein [Planctomycetaceae bacterium]
MRLPASRTKVLIVAVLACLLIDTVLFALLIRHEVGRSLTAGIFAGLVGALQWLVGITRERERSTWEAIRTYYTEGDTPEFRRYRQAIREGTASDEDKAAFLNFYEKWGWLVRFGYLPLDIFDGASGVSIVSVFDNLGDFISKRKEHNPRYAQSCRWLVDHIQHSYGIRSSEHFDPPTKGGDSCHLLNQLPHA